MNKDIEHELNELRIGIHELVRDFCRENLSGYSGIDNIEFVFNFEKSGKFDMWSNLKLKINGNEEIEV